MDPDSKLAFRSRPVSPRVCLFSPQCFTTSKQQEHAPLTFLKCGFLRMGLRSSYLQGKLFNDRINLVHVVLSLQVHSILLQ